MSEKLFYKRYFSYPIEIPEDSIILRQCDVDALVSNYPNDYPKPFCLEVDGINRIGRNEDGWFDFDKSIVDIGAGLGEYCWLTPFRHAYAFEPNKETVYAMAANLLLRGRVGTTEIFECFLSSEEEKEVLFNGFNTMDGNPEDMVRIETRTLDSFNLDNIGLIKIDVEMHEYEVLCGAKKTLERNGFPPVVFECFKVGMFGMTEQLRDRLYGFLRDYGYTIHEGWINDCTHLAVHRG